MLKRAAIENAHLAASLVIKGPRTYIQIQDTMKEYVNNCEAFEQNAMQL